MALPSEPLLIFDGDDTLWKTMPLYAASKTRFFHMLETLGFNGKTVAAQFEERDAKNVSRWGFTIERFRRSMIETYGEFMRSRGEEPSLRDEQRVSRIATALIRNRTRPTPFTRQTLQSLFGNPRNNKTNRSMIGFIARPHA